MSEQEIINRVAESDLVNIDMDSFYQRGTRIAFDLKDVLYEGLILREKDFRDFVSKNDWSKYKDAFVALHCSADAIVPVWAFMLVAIHLEPHAKKLVFGDLKTLETELFEQSISTLEIEKFRDAKLIIHGCSHIAVPESAYVSLTRKLRPVAHSIMYGEACSAVPLYKKRK